MKHADPLLMVLRGDMPCVTPLIPVEDPGIDPNPMIRLFSRLEEPAAEREICNILDAINTELTTIRSAASLQNLRECDANFERLTRKSGRLGLHGLARAATDVSTCIHAGDEVALAATMARLMRIADRSMCEIWNSAAHG